MPERFRVKVYADDCVREMRAIDKRVDKGTMWALRETGRLLARRARAAAPVYKGDRDDVESGLLKKSIKSSRRIKKSGRVQSLKIGPRGERVHLYAGKAEVATGFMHKAYVEVTPAMSEIHARAWRKAMDVH